MTDDNAELRLEGGRADVRSARQFAERTLTGWGLGDYAVEVTLVASELVTNAVLHARTAITFVMRRDNDRLRLEVSDGSAILPRPCDYTDLAATGRGLRLVENVATAWGAEANATGKTVWCELAVPEVRAS